MTDEYVKDEDKMLCAASYAFGVPSLYIILTDKRKDKFTGFHGTQSLFMWIGYVVVWIVMKVIIDVVWSIVYLPVLSSLARLVMLLMWLYALWCGYRAYVGEYFKVPYVSDLMERGGSHQ